MKPRHIDVKQSPIDGRWRAWANMSYIELKLMEEPGPDVRVHVPYVSTCVATANTLHDALTQAFLLFEIQRGLNDDEANSSEDSGHR